MTRPLKNIACDSNEAFYVLSRKYGAGVRV